MKVNFSQNTIEAIAELQEYPMLRYAIEDVENFIIENIDTEIGDEEMVANISKQALSHLKFLRKLRDLLKKICVQDEN